MHPPPEVRLRKQHQARKFSSRTAVSVKRCRRPSSGVRCHRDPTTYDRIRCWPKSDSGVTERLRLLYTTLSAPTYDRLRCCPSSRAYTMSLGKARRILCSDVVTSMTATLPSISKHGNRHITTLMCLIRHTDPADKKEAKFQEMKQEAAKDGGTGSFFAFHGSSGDHWHGIVHLGLKNMSGACRVCSCRVYQAYTLRCHTIRLCE